MTGRQRGEFAQASVTVVGAGRLGSVVLGLLAEHGFGRIGVVDGDRADAAAATAVKINPAVLIEAFPVPMDTANALAMLAGSDMAVDCSNNLETRAVVNTACQIAKTPFVTGAVSGSVGFVLAVDPGTSACPACAAVAQPEPEPEPASPTSAHLVASLQVAELMKGIAEVENASFGTVAEVDISRRAPVRYRNIERDPSCPICG